MTFFYILNKKNALVEVGKISSERGDLMRILIDTFDDISSKEMTLFLINFELIKLKILIENLLSKRELKSPDYVGRFSEEEIFEKKEFDGIELRLCSTGFDNKIIFLINIYNSILKNEEPYYLLFTNNHNEFREWKANNIQK